MTNKDEKKAAIAGTAVRLFTERGFHGTPTSLIAREAGISNGTLFHYFPTKEELINFAYYEIKGRMARCIAEGVDDERTLEEKARMLWRNAILWGVEYPDEYMFVQQFGSSPYIRKLPPVEILKDAGPALDIFREVIKNSPLSDAGLEVAFTIIFSPINAVVRAIIDSGETFDRDLLIDRSFSLMWKGLTDE
jgi:AcrR family transcriptional regulator